jgi:putative aldouronate transport system permease protein
MWNSFFPALIFLTDKGLKPLSIFLRRILILGEMSASATTDEGQLAMFKYGVQFKYSTIILSILPIVFIYPYFQQYFVKGVMLGAVKE